METRCLYLSRADVEAVGVGMTEIIAALEKMFEEKAAGRVEMPPKPGVHPGADAFIHAMPAYIPELKAAGLKWVSGFPENTRRGFPYISGLIVLNDVETGFPTAVMDCTWITAKRTGAATAIASKHLARPVSKVVGILGCGVQGRSNLEALQAVFSLQTVMAYDIVPEAQEEFKREVDEQFDIEVICVKRPEDAVKGCDIVVTAGPLLKSPHETIQSGWLDPGAFASLVDYDSYWSRAALRETDKFCTDDVAQMEYYKSLGYFRDIPPVYAELAELVSGKKPGRESEEERTMTCNLGLALEDITTAPLVYRRAVDKNIGTWLPI